MDKDLAVANNGSGDVTILKNNGAANFNEPGTSPEEAGVSPYSVAAADLDGDTDQDLAVVNAEGWNVTILRNNGSGNFTEPASSPEPVGFSPHSVVAADLNGDSTQDLAVANLGDDNVTILRNQGSGNFKPFGTSPETVGEVPYSVVAADIDDDGDQDLAVASAGSGAESGDVTILKNTGTGNFHQPGSSPERAGHRPRSLAAASLDVDSDRDLAITNFQTDDVTILRTP